MLKSLKCYSLQEAIRRQEPPVARLRFDWLNDKAIRNW